MPIFEIKKRNGSVVPFSRSFIENAIHKASLEAEALNSETIAKVTDEALSIVEEKMPHGSVPDVEMIQDAVEMALLENDCFLVAKKYILYRAERARIRAEKRLEELEKVEKNLLRVTKRSGKKEKFKKEKLQETFAKVVGEYAEKCDFDEVFGILKLMLIDGIATKDLLKNLRKACLDLVSIDNIAWQHIAGRLYALEFYKEVEKNRKIPFTELYEPKHYLKLFKDYVKEGLYSANFFDHYTEENILEAATWINKNRDLEYGYSTMLALGKRYLLNPNKFFRELPQEMYLSVALFLAIPEKKEDRLKVAKQMYEVCSSQKLSLPTPTLLNARTNHHQLSSCFKLNINDSLRDIYHQFENMAQISKFGGGIGVYAGHIRSRGAAIRYVKHASGGVIPWVRVMNDTATAVNQLGSRNGAISPTLDVWHRDIHDFLNLQTETGDMRQKAFDIFPAVSVPDIFMQRLQENGKWTLFDPYEIEVVTGKRLENLFCEEFSAFYEECEQNPQLELKTVLNAKDLMKEILKTTVETGMPYVFYRDTVNRVNPNKHAGNIYSTQLCTEICQNTSPSKFLEEVEENGTVSVKHKIGDTVVCNLASINVAKVFEQKDIDEVFPVAMRILDNVITLNFYPIKEAEMTSKKYRSVGLGFLGLAEHLACQKLAYDKENAREYVDELFEKYALATLENSNALATERGKYELFDGSEWSKGILFGRNENWYKNFSKNPTQWAKLLENIKKTGLRFSYHLSPAPNTSTAGVVGTTAGLLPIYQRLFVETNSIAPVVTVAPNLSSENFWFYKEYKRMDMNDVIDMFTVIYKWIDQSASFEWMIDPSAVSPAQLYGYYVKAWKQGIKTVYYVRSLSGEMSESCESCSG